MNAYLHPLLGADELSVSDSHEVMTALIVVLPLIVVVQISLQLHRSLIFSLMKMGAVVIRYVSQLVASAQAAVDEAVRRGVC
jgi:hypothetical protein